MYAAHRLGTRFRLRLLQDSRQGGLPLLPPQVSNRRLLGRFLEGESMNGTTLRVCAGWRLDLLLKRRDMEKLTAKQTASDLTEAEAIKQAQAGDAAAFEFLYKAHCRRVYSLCLRMIKNPAEAEDLTQQAFLQLFRKISTFRGESGFSTWLHRVTVNIVLTYLRRKKPVEILAVDLATGQMRPSGYVLTGGAGPISVTVDPTGQFAYVVNFGSDNVSAFAINANTGALTAVGSSAAGTTPISVTVDPSGKFAYVANLGSNNVSAFTINPRTGALTAVGVPVTSGASPSSLAVEPTGRFAYVTNRTQRNLPILEPLSAVSRMVAFISHDLRQPLTAILANAEFLT